ncbi:tRNA pseudouridine synthase A [Tistrella bauzanensis]|uniref:tRNA pseudouridine synthase A n=1 Tax=Tistrella bauzanensis TaxID=657419 RepID=A0ABQ1J5Z1_9PROT|nr:tRNA pseudouridine(38-40) synthase TruA [Tistrella bauzanensis]GGB59561.1 tRNA pseudouridine synthase A [Tistrella bauzanensis]
MPRWKLTIEYDGSGFVGWQRQDNGRSVQQVVEEAIARYVGEPCVIKAAGRTDAGVHATAQVAHVDLPRADSPFTTRSAINHFLKPDAVAIIEAEPVPDCFDARFTAIGRGYVYRIVNRPAHPALDRDRVWHLPWPLDVEAMNRGAERLLGHHDFTSFRSTDCQAKSPMRTLDALWVERAGEIVTVTTRSRSFLHNQVRIMVGTLAMVGRERWTPDDVSAALAARRRAAAGPTAPPQGLCLDLVTYPPPAEWQAMADARDARQVALAAIAGPATAPSRSTAPAAADQRPPE